MLVNSMSTRVWAFRSCIGSPILKSFLTRILRAFLPVMELSSSQNLCLCSVRLHVVLSWARCELRKVPSLQIVVYLQSCWTYKLLATYERCWGLDSFSIRPHCLLSLNRWSLVRSYWGSVELSNWFPLAQDSCSWSQVWLNGSAALALKYSTSTLLGVPPVWTV